jgi:hypothetical protein
MFRKAAATPIADTGATSPLGSRARDASTYAIPYENDSNV